MNIINYKKVTFYDVGEILEKELKLTDEQKWLLGGVLNNLPYTFVDLREPIPAVPILRLTIPFYFLFWVLLVLFIPIKWLFTGNGKYKYGEEIISFLYSWKNKLNL